MFIIKKHIGHMTEVCLVGVCSSRGRRAGMEFSEAQER